MVVRQGEVWWAELPEPTGSEAGYRRPVLVTGLPQDSIANTALILAVNRAQLSECVGEIGESELELVFLGIDLVLGRS